MSSRTGTSAVRQLTRTQKYSFNVHAHRMQITFATHPTLLYVLVQRDIRLRESG
ncbi:hypothetical protein H6F89_33825 [Cyanobacteria bacterium FACHB-63]|nr:hypothetical protein [Cyanobacteria bacterium FACHB-63]